ncbi:MAG TPA: cation:proton antiporter [Gemmatimonadales bacterium]|nr:cation:proton antiporter [Gemmatimonadales bacterium]
MHDVHEFLRSLTIVLGIAALTTVLFQRLRQPVVLGYIIAGLLIGPHVPFPLVANGDIVRTLSELGVILLMFSLGLEFSLSRLVRVGPTAGVTAIIQSFLVAWLGFLMGRLFGWSVLESVFVGAMIAISSTTIIAKAFDEQGIGGRLRELVVGVLLLEDLIAVVFLAALTAIATGAGLSPAALLPTIGRLTAFLLALVAVGILLVPRFIRFVVRLGRKETTLVASVGLCFATAYLAQEAGYSVALGAFIAGSLVAESGHSEAIEHLVEPLRDVFLAIFFVSVGMLIDPALALQHWGAIAAFTVLVIVGKVLTVSFGAFLGGTGIRTSVQAGMSMAQIGEFSFIIAGVGVTLGATRDFLYPIAVAVSAITTLTTPWLIRASEPFAALIDRKLPHPLQTFAALYSAWLERLRNRPNTGRDARVTRIVRLLVLDALFLTALIVLLAVELDSAAGAITRALAIAPSVARGLVIGAGCAVALPLLFGIGRLSRRLGAVIGATAIPHGAGKVDLDAAPRQALVLTLQLGAALVTGAIVLALTQAFLPPYVGPAVLAALLIGFGFAIWRRATNLDSHVHAGAQAVVEALAKYARAGQTAANDGVMEKVHRLLPGLGTPVALALMDSSPAVGRSLAELNLRGRTGATVLAISRGAEAIVAPGAAERLRSGDVLGVTGTEEAVAAARAILNG